MRIAVLGGGNGAYAAAADLSEKGHEVRFWRRDAIALDRLRAAGVLLHCDAPIELLRQRVRERAQRGGDASEADETVLQQLTTQAEPLAADETALALHVDTSRPLSAAALAARWLAARRSDTQPHRIPG